MTLLLLLLLFFLVAVLVWLMSTSSNGALQLESALHKPYARHSQHGQPHNLFTDSVLREVMTLDMFEVGSIRLGPKQVIAEQINVVVPVLTEDGQQLKVDALVDTGSQDFIIYTTTCSNCQCPRGASCTLFPASAAGKIATPAGHDNQIEYGDAKLALKYWRARVENNGLPFVVGGVTKVLSGTKEILHTLGMHPGSSAATDISFVSAMLHNVQPPLDKAWVFDNTANKQLIVGQNLGGTRVPFLTAAEVQQLTGKSVLNGWYMFHLTDVSWQGQSLPSKDRPTVALIDTGTSALGGSAKVIGAIKKTWKKGKRGSLQFTLADQATFTLPTYASDDLFFEYSIPDAIVVLGLAVTQGHCLSFSLSDSALYVRGMGAYAP